MLKRSIDRDPFEPAIEEKIFRVAKRACTVLAVAAVTLTVLDLIDIRSVQTASNFMHAHRQRLADLPNMIRAGLQSIALASPSPPRSGVPSTRRGDIAIASMPAQAAADANGVLDATSPLSELSSLRHLDAVEVAMEQSPVLAMAETPAAPAAIPAAVVTPSPILLPAPSLPPVILASVEATPPPEPQAAPAPLSLPMSAAIPLDMVPLPRPAPGVPPPSPAELLHLDDKGYAKAERCLANAVYFEARSEPVAGQIAVAQVVMNRAFSGFYPNDVCAVVYQNASRHLACQFTFACDGKRKIINERGAWARANRIAKQTLDGKLYEAKVGTSTHYHAVYVHPNWVREMRKMVRYGVHNFYRPYAWGNGSDEPVWGSAALAQNKKK